MKVSTATILAVVCGIVGFAIGYWNQLEGRKAAEASLAEATRQAETLRAQLAKSTDRANLGELLASYLLVKENVEARNYGRAQQLSTAWFDAVRTESQRTSSADSRKALETALSFRDQATAALAKSDADALVRLTGIEDAVRSALRQPGLGAVAPATAAPATAAPATAAPPTAAPAAAAQPAAK